MEIHQFLPSLSQGSAVGDHALVLRRLLRQRFVSEIFYERADPRDAAEGKHFWEYLELPSASSGENVLIYHLSIGHSMIDFLLERPERLIVYYHNITPPEFFAPYDPDHAVYLERGRREIGTLGSKAVLAWGASEFSRRDLEKGGYRRTAVLPILIDFERFDADPDPATLDRLRQTKTDGPDMLFVGRLAPNKRQEDLIKLLHLYRRHIRPGGRLFLVGPHHHTTFAYSVALSSFARELGVDPVFRGDAPFGELLAYYRTADVFVSMSEHEGFGAPLLEAMHLGLPVVAYGAGSIPEIVGDGGLVFDDKDLLRYAMAVDRLWRDPQARGSAVEAGRKRAEEFSLERVAPVLFEQLERVL